MKVLKNLLNKIALTAKQLVSGVRVNLVIATALSLAMVLLAFAVKYTVNHVFVSSNSTKSVQSWEYDYLDDADDAPNLDELKQSSYITPISTKGKTNYCYLRHTFEKVNESTFLTIKADHAPMKILVNGEEVYNNHYGTDMCVGNSFNQIELQKTALAQTVEVYMGVPYSIRFDVSISSKGNTGFEFSKGMIFAIVVFAIGVIMLLVSLVFSIKNKHLSSIIYIAIYDILAGGSAGLWCFLQDSYALNAPLFAGLSDMLCKLTVILSAIIAFRLYGNHKKGTYIITALAAVSAACMMIPNVAIVSRLAPIVCSALLVLALGFSHHSFLLALGRRAKGAFSVWFALTFNIVTNFVLTAQMFFGDVSYFIVFNTMMAVVFTIVMTRVEFDKSSVKYKKKQDEYNQFVTGLEWINTVNSLSKKIITLADDDEKIISAAKTLKQIIASIIEGDDVKMNMCIGKATDNGFENIYSDIAEEQCNFFLTNYRYATKKNISNIYSGETYFDIVAEKQGQIYAIIHLECNKELINKKTVNVATVFSAILTIVLNTTGNVATDEDFIINFLSNLAEQAEIEGGGLKSHITNVSTMALCICVQLGLSEEEIKRIGYAAALHDIGKIVIPDSILDNQGYLSDDEKEIIKSHAEFGGKLLTTIPGEFLHTASQIAHYHHENLDGSGYYGLKGNDIPLSARITEVADVFDALTSVRSYKSAWSDERAIAYLQEYSGTKFDKNVVDAFVNSYDLICELKKGGEA